MIVLDNSVFISAIFKDEANIYAKKLFGLIIEGEISAFVPPIFLLEAGNVIIQSKNRGRISQKIKEEYFEILFSFPVITEQEQNFREIFYLSDKHKLTPYDASYLEIAIRKKIPLITFDKKMTEAAKKEKIKILDL